MSHPGHHHPNAMGRSLTLSLSITLGFAAIEALTGWWAGSLALLGDAGHMVTDSGALGIAALATWLAGKGPSVRHSYGLGRAEFVAALVNAVIMLVVVVGITVAAIQRLLQPTAVKGEAVMAVAVLGFGVNLIVVWLLGRGHRNVNIRGALLHVLGDLVGSVAAIASGAVIAVTGWTPIDPILSLFIVLLILFSGLRLLHESLHALMEGVPFDISLPEVGRAMAAEEGVVSVHDLHIWSLSSERVALSAHVVVWDLKDWERVLACLRRLLQARFGIDHVTLQPERERRPLQLLDGHSAGDRAQ
jgi:cobalt-zinc-cadmium efflux system protein